MIPLPGGAPAPLRLAPGSVRFLLLLAGLMTVGAASTDINLPAVATIAQSFAAPLPEAQLTVSVFFLGFGLGQLFAGPLSDRFGRRPVILAGLALYLLATIGCILATSLGSLLVWRAVQGTLAAFAPVLARAVVRDLFDGPRMARVLSFATAVFILAPILAPSVGALLLEMGGWRWIFALLAVYGALLWLAGWRWLPETLRAPDPMALRPRRFVEAWRAVLGDPRSCRYAAVSVANFVVLVVYLTNSPAVFMDQYGLSSRAFAGVFALVALASAAGNLVNARLVRRIPLERLVAWACAGGFATSAIAIPIVLGDPVRLPLLIVLLALGFFCFSTVMANATALALQPHGAMAGAASSVIGVLQTVVPAVVASLAALLPIDRAVLTAGAMAAAFLAAVMLARRPPRASRSHPS